MSYNDQYDETVSVGEWIVTMLLCAIPVVNIILIFVWAFGSSKPSKRNYFRAQLLLALIVTALGALVIFGGISMGYFSKSNFFGLLGR